MTDLNQKKVRINMEHEPMALAKLSHNLKIMFSETR